ncbi:MAG: thrombospondin type 3 repeat-containing protein [Chromatiales bacterium]|nr:thrombospondin type 3 repeat-containing protein [Chromatiales bacterium]
MIPTDLGPERIDGAGVHSFEIGPIAGPVEPDRDVLSVLVFFDLSPGDRVTVQGRFIADLGTAVPVCAIPLLPGDADLDVDGVEDSADNCPATPNPTQSDLDGDGAGDVCDADADGDGESNADEVAHGTDPLDATSNRRRQRAILGPLELLLSE